MTRYRNNVLEAAFERLIEEVFDGGAVSIAELEIASESVNGDPSHLPDLAREVFEKVVVGEALTPLDRLWLSWVLDKIMSDSDAALAVSGKVGRGAPKKGARSFAVAKDVLDHILIVDDVFTTTAAWERVSVRHNLSVDTVREYWALRKESVCCSRQSELGLDGEEDIEIDAAIDAVLKAKRKK